MRVVSRDVIEDSSQTRVISSELRYPSRWRRIHALRGADQPVQKVPSRDGHPGYASRTIQSRWEINVSDPRKCESNPGNTRAVRLRQCRADPLISPACPALFHGGAGGT